MLITSIYFYVKKTNIPSGWYIILKYLIKLIQNAYSILIIITIIIITINNCYTPLISLVSLAPNTVCCDRPIIDHMTYNMCD